MKIPEIKQTDIINVCRKVASPTKLTPPSPASDIFVSSNPGKHKLPRFLYHFCDTDSLEQIMKSGKILPSKYAIDQPVGVYLVDMNNFLKYWKTDKNWDTRLGSTIDGTSLSCILLTQALKDHEKLTCIRIPSKYLDSSLIGIRSQQKLAGMTRGIVTDHIKQGDSLLNKNLYNQRKEALEYFYKGNIPTDFIEVMHECQMPDKMTYASFYRNNSFKVQHKHFLKVMQEIFQNQPEQKGIQAQFEKLGN